MMVGTQQGNHQLGKSTKALTDQDYLIKRHHIHRQRSESPISLAASQSDIDNGCESEFIYHNPPAVTENQSNSS